MLSTKEIFHRIRTRISSANSSPLPPAIVDNTNAAVTTVDDEIELKPKRRATKVKK